MRGSESGTAEEVLTEKLLEELLAAGDLREFVGTGASCCPGASIGSDGPSLSDYLNRLLEEKGLKRSDVVRRAGLNSTFGYQIFTGARKASRNKLLQLAFAMGLTLREANRLLRYGEAGALYCKNRRDAIIIFALDKGYSLQEVEEALFSLGEETIC